MKRRSRLLRLAKWSGVVLFACVAIASIASMWLTVVWNSGQPDTTYRHFDRDPAGGVEFNLSSGLFGVGWRPTIPPLELQESIRVEKGELPPHPTAGRRAPRRAGWTVRTHAFYFRWWPAFRVILPMTYTTNISGKTTTQRWTQRVTVPLWIPLVLIAIPTAFLWWRESRRPKPGHCPCGYDLTGNVSGKCPECGRETSNADA